MIDVHTGLSRDYSKPVSIKDIVQKHIEVPCIFGDRGLILKSLENESGAIKLPLFILQSTDIKTDTARNADLHVDVFYQQDDAFSKLPETHPLYRPYALSKRRGLPITIDYTLTLIAKYKEDLDQMCSNWMVHYRPDIYVKWWHPRNNESPLESEILWNQAINIESPSDNPGTEKFQWKASTSFTYKSWLFPGLNYLEDSINNEKLIEYFNYYPWSNYNTNNEDKTDDNGFTVFGNLYNKENSGFFAVDKDQKFENNGSDPAGILKGKYAVNNVESNASSVLYDSISGILNENEPMIKDILGIGDIPSNIGLLNSYPTFNIYQDYLAPDPIENEAIGFRYVYFKGGFPLSALTAEPPSGDFIFKYFYSEQPSFITSTTYTSNIVSAEFGKTYTDMLSPNYTYDINKKELKIFGEINNDNYKSYIETIINSTSGIQQKLSLTSKFNSEKPISLEFIRAMDNNFCIDKEKSKNNLKNINIWNDKFLEYPDTNIRFTIEYDDVRMKLFNLKQLITMCWDELSIDILDEDKKLYQLECDNSMFSKYANIIGTNLSALTVLHVKQEIVKDNITYTLLLNNYMFIVLKTTTIIENNEEQLIDDIIDYGIISMPEFGYHTCPVFNVTYPEANLVYGISVKSSLGIN